LPKNSQPFGKKFHKTVGGDFLTRTVVLDFSIKWSNCTAGEVWLSHHDWLFKVLLHGGFP